MRNFSGLIVMERVFGDGSMSEETVIALVGLLCAECGLKLSKRLDHA